LPLIYCFKTPALTDAKKNSLLSFAAQNIFDDIKDIGTEFCFYIESGEALSAIEIDILKWLISETFEPEKFSLESFLTHQPSTINHHGLIEVGPRMNFMTAWSTNAVAVCHACGLTKVRRIERSRRYQIVRSQKPEFRKEKSDAFLNMIHDRMTECPYPEQLKTFETGIRPEPVYYIPMKEKGADALRKINLEMGLGLDDWDIDYYHNLFVKDIGRTLQM